ncbi:hypothetical protein N008_17795 [Hymenobacter sp. APR13]|nr:hypothetical protein N008_17795 [Hymenobacter sp. APR13]
MLRKNGLYKAWGSKSLVDKGKMLADFACFDPSVCRKILQIWFTRNTKLKQSVWDALVLAGYEPVVPDFKNQGSDMTLQTLRAADVKAKEDQSYFAPSGVQSDTPEHSTLMAYLLGWSVSEPEPDTSKQEPVEEQPLDEVTTDALLSHQPIAPTPVAGSDVLVTVPLKAEDGLTPAWDKDWDTQAQHITTRMATLAEQVEEAALLLRRGEWPVLDSIVHSAVELRADTLGLSALIGLQQEVDNLSPPASLTAIRTHIQQRQVAWENIQQQQHSAQAQRHAALEILTAIQCIQHKTIDSFGALPALHQQAATLAAQIIAADVLAPISEQEELTTQAHPLAHFLHLIRHQDGYSQLGEEDEQLHQAQDFLDGLGGRALTSAWSRGNLIERTPDAQQPASAPLADIPLSEQFPPATDTEKESGADAAQEDIAGSPQDEQWNSPEPADTIADAPVLPVEEQSIAPTEAAETRLPVHSSASKIELEGNSVEEQDEQVPAELSRPSRSVRTTVRATSTLPDADEVTRRQWAMIERGDTSLAFQLARYMEDQRGNATTILPSWLLRSVLLGPHVRLAYGRLASLLTDDGIRFEETALQETANEQTGARHLLAWAAALRPALAAPATTLGYWLSLGGVPRLPDLSELANRIAQRQSIAPLDEVLLGTIQTQQQWEEQLREWQDSLQEWERQQEQAKFRQSISNDIVQFWKSCWQEGRPVAIVLAGLASETPDHSALLDSLAVLRERSGLRDEVKRSKIDYSAHIQNNTDAQRWLDERVQTLADLVRQHQELWHRQPANSRYKDSRYDDQELVTYLHKQLPLVLQELDREKVRLAEDPDANQPWRVALMVCEQTLTHLHGWLQHPETAVEEMPSKYWLGQALLRLPTLMLDVDWEPAQYDDALGVQLWELTAQPDRTDWAKVYQDAIHETQEQRGANHLATARLLALAEAAMSPSFGHPVDLGQDLQELRSNRTADLRQQSRDLQRAIAGAERELVRGRRYGYLNEVVEENARQEIERLRQISQTQSELEEDFIFDYRSHHQAVRMLQEHLRDMREQAIVTRTASVEQQLQELLTPPSDEDQSKVRVALQQGRLALADDYLAQLRDGRDLVPHDATPSIPCMAQLRLRVQQLQELQQQKPVAIERQLQQEPLLPDGLPLTTSPGGASAYAHWIEVKQTRTLQGEVSRSSFRHLLEYVGFEVENVSKPTGLDRTSHQYLDLHTSILHERQQSPIGRFGSEAKGHYRVLCLWTAPEPVELSRLVGKCSNRDSAVLVFLFAPLPWRKREELGLYCRREGHTFLVFDELFLLYLLTYAEPTQRLGLFFRLQLPFIQYNPYLVSGKIPSEMFYGREDEKRRLVSHQTDGAIIIYGGRQLGKTMLLHQAVRENHRPTEEHYVVFLDIYQLGRDIKEVSRIGYELMQLCKAQKIGTWPTTWRENLTLRRFLDHLTDWVLSENSRRLLILLDEADELLEQDAANDFAVVSEFRNAMQKTELRLKVVFSGLHNVQRTLNLPNQPLVQLGKPMNIGPLAPEQGIDLVRTPLESMGFCFGQIDDTGTYQATDALIDQIAVETNYYPSLIQIFCHRLLEGLYKRQQRQQALLTQITEDDVQRASQDARDEIKNRFNLTLDLNPRYRLLAYIIADFTTQAAGPVATLRGLLPGEVREWALEYWPAGWKIRHEESYFKALLDEMVELGVLEKSTTGQESRHYRLRTANVRALLGTPEEIRHVLSKFETELPNAGYMPSIVHADFPGAKSAHHNFRGPLTVETVRRLDGEAGVSIVCGTRAAGLELVEEFLSRRFKGRYELVENSTTQFAQLETCLEKYLTDKTAQTVQVVLVKGNCTGKLIEQTLKAVLPSKKHKAKRPVHVVFEMDPDTVRRFLSADITLERLQTAGVEIIPLTPWEPAAVKDWQHKEMIADSHWKKSSR